MICAHAGWTGLPIVLQVLPGSAEVTDLQVHQPSLAVVRSGHGKRRYASGHHARDLYSSPSMFELYAGGYGIDRASWQGIRGEVIGVQFPAPLVNRLLHASGSGFQLPVAHERFDERVVDLTLRLWEEAREGGPRGRLYADGLSLALLGLLVEAHGACPQAAGRSTARLNPVQCTRVRDYIHEHLGAHLAVEHLAALVGMSAAHFSRAFKSSFGMSPHAYVTEQRLGKACRLLREETQRPLAETALALGFSSQSHFTASFKRKVGMTPGQWQRGRE